MEAPGTSHHDRHLLFAVLAIKLEFATPGQVLEFLERCSDAPGGPSLGSRMVEEGLLTAQQHDLLVGMCDQATACCGGDAGRTLERLGGERTLRSCFGRLLRREGAGRFTVDETLPLPSESASHVTVEQPGRYTIVDEQGRGGQSRVYRARDEHVGRQVAFKELLEGEAPDDDRERVLRFVREARITGSLEHPSIIPIYEIGKRLDGRLYYTMRLVKGRTLADAIRDCKSLAERLELLGRFEDVCQAVAYAHDRGVIHRDLKPENVMVGAFGETLVLDWGLARAVGSHDEKQAGPVTDGLDSDVLKTAQGAIMGTPAYMSPEQARGDPDRIDQRSDVWGLGAMLYEILTGKPPDLGRNVVEILMALTSAPRIPPPRAVCPEIPPELSAIAERALQPWPESRYPNAGGMADDISRYLAGGRVASYTYSAWEIARQLVSRHLASSIVALVAIYALLGLGVLKHLQVREETSRARIEAAQAHDFATSMVGDFSRDLLGMSGGVSARVEILHAALAYLESNLPLDKATDAEKLRLATSRIELGLALNDDNRLEESTEVLQRGVDLIESLPPTAVPDNTRLDEALACMKLGDQLLARHKVDEATRQYERALALYQEQAAALPMDGATIGRVATAQGRLARISATRGRPDEAVKQYSEAVKSLKAAATRERSKPELQHLVSRLQYDLWDVLDTCGRKAEARAVLEEALGVTRRLATAWPQRAEYQEYLVLLLLTSEQFDEAIAVCRRQHYAIPDHWWYPCEIAEASLAAGHYQPAMLAAAESARLVRDDRRLATALLLEAASADLGGETRRARKAVQRILDLGDRLIPYPEWSWAVVLRSLRRIPPTSLPAVTRVRKTFEAFETARSAPEPRSLMQSALRSWLTELGRP